MIALQPLVAEFTIIGRLNDLLVDSKGRVRYLYLSTPKGEYAIAVAKKQPELRQSLQLGCKLKITGMRKNRLHKDEVEYKAYRLELLEPPVKIEPEIVAKGDRQKKASILVCQGKSCCQRGGMAINAQLQQELQAAGIAERVEIKTTGCMKQCKQAPQIVLPNRQRHSRIQPEQIKKIVNNLFISNRNQSTK